MGYPEAPAENDGGMNLDLFRKRRDILIFAQTKHWTVRQSHLRLCGFVPSTWVLSYEDLLLALRSAGRAYKHVNKAQIQNWIYAYIYASVIYNQHACYAVLRDLHSREKTV